MAVLASVPISRLEHVTFSGPIPAQAGGAGQGASSATRSRDSLNGPAQGTAGIRRPLSGESGDIRRYPENQTVVVAPPLGVANLQARPMAISAYDDNHFAYRKPTRNQTMVGAERKMKRHLPLWLDVLIILVLVAAAGTVGFVLTHPSAHRSPGTIATDFASPGRGRQLHRCGLRRRPRRPRHRACDDEVRRRRARRRSERDPHHEARVVQHLGHDRRCRRPGVQLEPGVQQPAGHSLRRDRRLVVRGLEPPPPVSRSKLTDACHGGALRRRVSRRGGIGSRELSDLGS